MDQHVKILGWSHVLYGLAGGVISLFLLVFLGGFGHIFEWGDHMGGLGPVAVGYVTWHLLMAVPEAAVGAGLLKLREGARFGGIILSAMNLVNIPVGSALGVYGLWVLLSPETEPLFRDPLFKKARPPAPQSSPPDLRARRPTETKGRSLYPPAVKPVRPDLPE
jgi:hypothetical protein